MDESSFTDLPDNIVLDIFQYIHHKELLRLSRVCKHWQQLISCRWLWKHVQFSSYPIKKVVLSKIIRRYFNNSTLSLELCGKFRKNSISNNVLTLLSERSPMLQSFKIEDEDMSDVRLDFLPLFMQSLNFVSCEIPLTSVDYCFGKFENLMSLSFHRCPCIKHTHLQRFGKLNNLKKLNLSACYRVDDEAVKVITKNFPNLRSLSLLGCAFCSDVSCTEIVDNLSKLESLEIEEWTQLTHKGVDKILTSLKCLKFLSVKCHDLNNGKLFIHGSRLFL